MSRRRAQKEQEREDFLEQNPELQTFTTRIEVVEVEDDDSSDSGSDDGSDIDFVDYEAKATLNGEEAEATTRTGKGDPFPDLTLAKSVSTEAGTLRAFNDKNSEDDGPGGRDVLSLSEYGFGVAERGGHSSSNALTVEDGIDGPPMAPPQDYALDGDEVLTFNVGGRGGRKEQALDGLEGPFGPTEFEIDYTVLGGTGTVELVLVDRGYGDLEYVGGPDTVEVTSIFLGIGDEGSLSVEMPDGTYDRAMIMVTGSLEIAVVGIEITDTFVGFDLPI
jgi:hypothetical protein